MDSGWAVLLGAFIAGAFGFVGPWLREARTERLARERAREVAIREATLGVLKDAVFLATTNRAARNAFGEANRDAIVSISRLGVLLTTADADIDLVVQKAIGVIGNGESPTQAANVLALQSVMHRWVRGELNGSEVREAFDAQVAMRLRDRAAAVDLTTPPRSEPGAG